MLSSMGLVEHASPGGGAGAAAREWNVFDPRVIRWRLDGPGPRGAAALARGAAARVRARGGGLAAERATPEQCAAMAAAVREMTVQARRATSRPTSRPTRSSTRRCSRRPATRCCAPSPDVVAEVLAGRTHHDLMPARPNPVAIRLHGDVAQAVGSGDAPAAERRDASRPHRRGRRRARPPPRLTERSRGKGGRLRAEGAGFSQVMNRNCLFTHVAWCVKRQLGLLTWETGEGGPRGHPG